MFNEVSFLSDCTPYFGQIAAVANKYGIDPNIGFNQIQQESRCLNQCSAKGACGWAQFMPATWLEWGSPNPADRTNPALSLDAWGAYMRDLLDTNGGDYRLALAAYNSGQKNVNYYGDVPPFQETQNYVAKILGALGLGTPAATSTTPQLTATDTGPAPVPATDYGQASGGGGGDGLGLDLSAMGGPLLIAAGVFLIWALMR